MLSILDPSTLAPFASFSLSRIARSGEPGALIQIQALVQEDDGTLPYRNLAATLDWNDGSPLVSLAGVQSISVDKTRVLRPGQYAVRLTANNFRSPVHDTVKATFFVAVAPSLPAPVPSNYIYGPILPRDAGSPNMDQWSLDLGSDIHVLESSVKMLLLTSRGERLMEPDYGTDLWRMLFETDQNQTVDALAREEVARAMARWEPRVSLLGLSVAREPNSRSATLFLSLASKLSQQTFETAISFAS
jgi:phage baseplate assembly protein W